MSDDVHCLRIPASTMLVLTALLTMGCATGPDPSARCPSGTNVAEKPSGNVTERSDGTPGKTAGDRVDDLLDRAETYLEDGRARRAAGVLESVGTVFELTEAQSDRLRALEARATSGTPPNRERDDGEAAENEETNDDLRARLRENHPSPRPTLEELQRLLSQPNSSEEEQRRREKGWNLDWKPSRAWVEDLNLHETSFVMKGRAVTADDVAEFLHRLDTSKYFSDVRLDYALPVESDDSEGDESNLFKYRIVGGLQYPNGTGKSGTDSSSEVFAAPAEIPRILKSINTFATRTGATVESFERKPNRSKSGYEVVPVAMEMRANFDQLKEFLRFIEEKADVVVDVPKLEVLRSSRNHSVVDVSATVTIYTSKPSGEN